LRVIDRYDSYIRPTRPELGAEAFTINKISMETLNAAPNLLDVLSGLVKFCSINIGKDTALQNIMLVGQNIKFDIGFLNHAFKKIGLQQHPFNYHTLSLDNIYILYNLVINKEFPKSVKLERMCEAFSIPTKGLHNAVVDIENTYKLFSIMLNGMLSNMRTSA
jgi:DNA polymerase III alpha subunit (gram-positive type)